MSFDPGDRPPPGGQGWQQPPPPGYGPPPQGWGPPPPAQPPPAQPPTGPAGLGGAPGSGGTPQDQAKGFFAALFDFSFNGFATFAFVKILYVAGTVLIALGYLFYVVTTFFLSPLFGVIVLVVGAVFALFALAFLRLSLEFYYAVVRMSEDIHHRR